MTAAIQTLWCELIVASLADAGVTTCVLSPGSRSTPLVSALVADGRLALPTIIDERAAAFFALGAARATGTPVALVCTSGTAAAHYLPALIEASLAGVPLIALTADRPPELRHCGASQTIDQVGLYGRFVRGAFELGAPVGSALALRAVRRTIVQAVALACGPHSGPVHVDVPLRKPLEPASPSTDDERALAGIVIELRAAPPIAGTPRLVADPRALDALAAAIAAEPHGLVIAGAMPVAFAAAREAAFTFAARAGYPVLAESGSQLRFTPCDRATRIDHFDLVCGDTVPAPRLIVQLGAEPVAAGWRGAFPDAARWVLADHAWLDPDSSARGVIVGDVGASLARLAERVPDRGRGDFAAAWHATELRAEHAIDAAVAAEPRGQGATVRAAIASAPAGTLLQIGNSLPIRIVDQVCAGVDHLVITQRGAAGIDGLVASAAGATRRGTPVLLILGDVSFAHDLGGLLAAREAQAPLAIVVIDNGGGQIFAQLPIADRTRDASFARHFLTAPAIDPSAVAASLGVRAITAASAAAVGSAVASALAMHGPTVIHAPVSATGARDLRRNALEQLAPTHRRSTHHG